MRRHSVTLGLLLLITLVMGGVGLRPFVHPAAAASDLVRTVSQQRTAGGGEWGSAAASCSGDWPVGLGFSGVIPPLYLQYGQLDGGGDSEARLKVRNTGRSDHPFTLYGLCLAETASDVIYRNLRRISMGPGRNGGLTVSCPTGTRPIAGTGGVERPADAIPPAAVTASYPTSRGWKIEVNNRAGEHFVDMTIKTSCAYDPRLQIQVVSALDIAAPPGISGKSATCPRGTELAGGGYRVPPFGPIQERDNLLVVMASRPEAANGREFWTVRVANNGKVSQKFSVYGVCVSRT